MDAVTIVVIAVGVLVVVGGIAISHITTKATLKEIEKNGKEK